MVNLLACALTITLTLFSSFSYAQPVRATLDRTEIIRGETVTLTIRVDGQQGGVQMDLSPLESNFQVVATRTSSQMRSINNSMEQWIDYNLTLFPLYEGDIVIPPLLVDGIYTQELAIRVEPKTETSIAGQELFMEAVIDKDSVFVQEQLLFTIRLYYTISGIRNPIFTELEMPDTVIQMIGTANQYEKLVEGVRYGVYEKQYALFPQRSGTLEIPDIMFRGEVTDGSSRYVFRNLNTRTITSYSEGHSIEVREKPANYPVNAIWLPASNITIREQWDNDFTNVRVGDAINRTIEIEAFGLDGAALPPLETPTVASVNMYPEPPEINRTYVNGNIVGERTQQNSLVMTETGTLRIPGVTLPWFDIDTEEVKYATLEDTAIQVGPVRSTSPNETMQLTTSSDGSVVDTNSTGPLNGAMSDSLLRAPTTPAWVLALAAALTALLLAYTVTTVKRRRLRATRSQAVPEVSAPMYRQTIAPEAESIAFKEFVSACEKNHLPALRLALIAWGRQYFADADLHNLDDLAQRTGDAQIKTICLTLQQALYGKNDQDAASLKDDINRLRTLITSLRTTHKANQRKEIKDQDYTLPPLYKV